MSENRRPVAVLIYDGECGICREWVDHWRRLTGTRIDYRPYQESAQDYPDIDGEAFRDAIQFIDSDVRHYSGAAASFQVHRGIGMWSALDWMYRHVPGFAPFC